MKLVDILARELRAWPKGFGKSVGQCHNGAIHSCGMPYLQSGQKFTRCDNYMFDVVSKAQWQAAVDALKAESRPTESMALHHQEVGRITRQWNGEGLPPVGAVCEVLWNESRMEYLRTKIFGVNENGQPIHRFDEGPKKYEYQADVLVTATGAKVFRPIRTPEQIAKQERSKACDKMYGVILDKVPQDRRNNGSDICEALYDAGYRKFEIVDN